MGAGCNYCGATVSYRTKTDTPIQKVPQSISVVTAEEMALHQPKSVKEALSYTLALLWEPVAHLILMIT